MDQWDKYRENAEQCRRMSRRALEPRERVVWLEMAGDWLRLIPVAPEARYYDYRTALQQLESALGSPEGPASGERAEFAVQEAS